MWRPPVSENPTSDLLIDDVRVEVKHIRTRHHDSALRNAIMSARQKGASVVTVEAPTNLLSGVASLPRRGELGRLHECLGGVLKQAKKGRFVLLVCTGSRHTTSSRATVLGRTP